MVFSQGSVEEKFIDLNIYVLEKVIREKSMTLGYIFKI